jgi:glycosyltransferase involved in cell wall biosynthesis
MNKFMPKALFSVLAGWFRKRNPTADERRGSKKQKIFGIAEARALLNAKVWPDGTRDASIFSAAAEINKFVRLIDLTASKDLMEADNMRDALSNRLFASLRNSSNSSMPKSNAPRIAYIASSLMPSRDANNVNVMKMCGALAKAGIDVQLHFIKNASAGELTRETIFNNFDIAHEFQILPIASSGHTTRNHYLLVCAAIEQGCTHFYTRSLKAAYFSALYGFPTALELHKPFSKDDAAMARDLFRLPSFKSLIVISSALKNRITDEFSSIDKQTIVIPDAADSAYKPSMEFKLTDTPGCSFSVGYAGHLYAGKGTEIVIQLSQRLPDISFHILGGYEKEITEWKSRFGNRSNVIFYGYRPHSQVSPFIKAVDVAIAPYARKVWTGDGRHDIAAWMSPLKLFEYMAVGKPIVASDLEVLREILEHDRTALLCNPDDIETWVAAIERLRSDQSLGRKLGEAARELLERNHTWDTRAIAAIGPLTKG